MAFFDCGEDAVESFRESIDDSRVSKADNAIKMANDAFSCRNHRLKAVAFGFSAGLYPITPLAVFSPEAIQPKNHSCTVFKSREIAASHCCVL